MLSLAGHLSCIYRGVLKDDDDKSATEVAVKTLKIHLQGMQELRCEMHYAYNSFHAAVKCSDKCCRLVRISRLHHLAGLLGFIIVFETLLICQLVHRKELQLMQDAIIKISLFTATYFFSPVTIEFMIFLDIRKALTRRRKSNKIKRTCNKIQDYHFKTV